VPGLKVPERFRRGIARTAILPQADFESLIAALQKAPSCKDSRELLAWIGDETPNISPADRKMIITSILPMFRVQKGSGVSVESFVEDVWDSISEESPSLLQGVDYSDFLDRLGLLIKQSSLDLASSRVFEAKREVEKNFCKILISTDLRPVFVDDLDETPSDMAVIHNFQIGYHDGMANHHEFYLSLDSGDLQKLKKAIADAENKVNTLERTLDQTGIRLHR
jgi:hypothetical protein